MSHQCDKEIWKILLNLVICRYLLKTAFLKRGQDLYRIFVQKWLDDDWKPGELKFAACLAQKILETGKTQNKKGVHCIHTKILTYVSTQNDFWPNCFVYPPHTRFSNFGHGKLERKCENWKLEEKLKKKRNEGERKGGKVKMRMGAIWTCFARRVWRFLVLETYKMRFEWFFSNSEVMEMEDLSLHIHKFQAGILSRYIFMYLCQPLIVAGAKNGLSNFNSPS